MSEVAQPAYDGKGTTTCAYEGSDADGATENRGLVTSETDSPVGTFTAAYKADGSLLVEDYPSGVVGTWAYDNAGNPTSLTYTKSGSTVAACSESYNAHGQLVKAATPLKTQNCAYDADGRLIQTQDVTSPASGSGWHHWKHWLHSANRIMGGVATFACFAGPEACLAAGLASAALSTADRSAQDGGSHWRRDGIYSALDFGAAGLIPATGSYERPLYKLHNDRQVFRLSGGYVINHRAALLQGMNWARSWIM